jgi:sec-independent protein translocase protein TatB
MFDIGFWELCLIAIVALLILGPERLPTAARTAGKWISKIRNMVAGVKQEIDRELQLDEIRSKMKAQEEALKQQTNLDDIQQSLDQTIADLDPIERTIAPRPQQDTADNETSAASTSDEVAADSKTQSNDSTKH